MSVQGFIATAMTQPVDVVKTRMMNAKPGDYKVQTVSLLLVAAYFYTLVGLLVAGPIFLVVYYDFSYKLFRADGIKSYVS